MKERNKRLTVRMGCWIEVEDCASCVTVSDLSENGISVMSSDPLPEGRVVVIKVFTPFAAGAVTVKGEVVWSRVEPEGGMGLKFLDMDEKTRGVLKSMARMLLTGKKSVA